MSSFIFRFSPFLLGAMVVAGITHIVSILLMPLVTARNPVLMLARVFQVNELEIIDPTVPVKVAIPFADPAMRVAVCSYDVSERPVRLVIETGESFLSVVFLQPNGQISYSVTDRAAVQRKLEIVVATPAQILALEAQDSEDEAVSEWRLKAQETKGVILIRALVTRPGEAIDVMALLNRTECYQD
jgi:uncharacterized membrane protein